MRGGVRGSHGRRQPKGGFGTATRCALDRMGGGVNGEDTTRDVDKTNSWPRRLHIGMQHLHAVRRRRSVGRGDVRKGIGATDAGGGALGRTATEASVGAQVDQGGPTCTAAGGEGRAGR